MHAAHDRAQRARRQLRIFLNERAPGRDRRALVFQFQIGQIDHEIHARFAREKSSRRRKDRRRHPSGLQRAPHDVIGAERQHLHVFVRVQAQMSQSKARALFISVAGPLDADDLAFQILRAFNIRPSDENHRSVTRKAAEHHHVFVLHRNRDHQVSRHDGQIDFVGDQRHRRDRTGGAHDFRVDPFFREKSRFLGDERNGMGHRARRVADADFIRLGLRRRAFDAAKR